MSTMPRELRVATRSSRLARAQAEEAIAAMQPLVPGVAFKIVCFDSPGDRDLDTPLSDASVPGDFFTRDIDEALRNGKADVAVHSAKDLPKAVPAGLAVTALLPARDIRDALVFGRNHPRERPPKTIGTSSPRRDEFIRHLYPDAQTRPLRGAIDQRLARLDAGDFDAIVVAACALERLGLADRIGEYLPCDPVPQQGRLALVVRADAGDLLAALRRLDVRRRAGLVALVGCPADPELLSVRADQYLRYADVILHDRLLPDEILLRIRSKAMPVGKAGGRKSIAQSEIHRLLLQQAEQGRLVVRLHGGDPAIYGHLAEELQFLTDWNLRTDVVTAVTAAQVAAARAQTPLTHRHGGGRLTLLTAHRPGADPAGPLPGPAEGNLAVYMGVNRADDFIRALRAAGWPDDASVIVGERLGYKDERVVSARLDRLDELRVQIPAVYLVGTRSFRTAGTTLFVGTEPEHFLNHGPLLHWPLIRLVARPLKERAATLHRQLARVRGVIFPGRFAVQVFMEALMQGQDARALAGKMLLAVGPATAEELARFGLRADRAAASLGGVRELAGQLTQADAGLYLYPCSDAAPQEERARALAAHGIELAASVFYANRAMPYRDLPRLPFERVLFTSTSTVKAYFENYPDERSARRAWLAVGPSTLAALEQLGLDGELLE